MARRTGRYGAFYGCSRFPECRCTCRVSDVERSPESTALDSLSSSPSLSEAPGPAASPEQPRLMREVPGFLRALRVALMVCKSTPRADLLATASAPARPGLTFVRPHDVVGACYRDLADSPEDDR